MFAERSRGLLDFVAAMLCLWAAAYYTPLGAVMRITAGWVLDVRTSAKPLLAYYSGGVYEQQGARAPSPEVPLPQVPVLVLGSPLAKGSFAVLAAMPAKEREHVVALARAHGQAPVDFGDKLNGPVALEQLLAKSRAALGGDEAAVLALFVGAETARFASQRAADRSLPALALVLPPSSEEATAHAGHALMLATAFELQWPVPEGTRVSSPFGWRQHPTLGHPQLHTGVDLAVPLGTWVRATAAGVVRRASEDPVNGRVVIIDHGRGVTTAYCHNSLLVVGEGDRVSAGQVVAHSGSTGRSTGPHLHYQLELGRRPTDPLPFRQGTGPVAVAPAPSDQPLPVRRSPQVPSPALRDAFRRTGLLQAAPDAPRVESDANATEQ